jgi:hypothetical protein
MAESHSMTAAERAAATLMNEHADVLRDAVAMVVAELMEAERSALRERGLARVRACISDDHTRLRNAIARILACPWQRCEAHRPAVVPHAPEP